MEVDYSSNELQVVLAGILQGNGNFIERVLARSVLPEEPPNVAEVEAWLVALRRTGL